MNSYVRESSKRILEDNKSDYFHTSSKVFPSMEKPVTSFQKNSTNEKAALIQGKYNPRKRFSIKNTSRKETDDDVGTTSSMEKLHDSLDDQTAFDSGLGSSSEYKTKVILIINFNSASTTKRIDIQQFGQNIL